MNNKFMRILPIFFCFIVLPQFCACQADAEIIAEENTLENTLIKETEVENIVITEAQTEVLTAAPEVTEPVKPPLEAPAQKPSESVAAPGVIRTSVPRLDVCQYSHNTSVIFGGKCEIGAMIRVLGGLEEIYTGSDHGDYLVEVPIAKTGSTILKLTAEMPEKEPSEEIEIETSPQSNVNYYEKSGGFGVVIGYNYMSCFADCLPDYLGGNLIGEKEIAALAKRTAKKISDLKNLGCEAEIIYLLVPNTVRLWPEDMPKRYTEYSGDTLLSQWKRGVSEGGAFVLDLTELMKNNKNGEFKIWHKTDSHWTEYGAYLGYTALMEHIAKKFPDAKPRPRSDFEFYNKEVNFGDIYATLGLSISDLRETTTFAKFNFDPPHYNSDYNTGHVGLYDENCAMKMSARLIHSRVQFAHTTKTNLTGPQLPSVYVLRDSFEGPLHAFYTDRFSSAVFKGMWNYNFNAGEIASVDPDYILYIISERTIKDVLFN